MSISYPDAVTFIIADYLDKLDNPVSVQEPKLDLKSNSLPDTFEPYLKEADRLAESGEDILIITNPQLAELLTKRGYECIEVRSAKPDLGLLCVFRPIPSTHSVLIRPPIPMHSVH
jgi:hypothetical protein